MFKLKLSKKTTAIIILVFSLGLGLLAFVFSEQLSGLQNLGYLGIFLANLIGAATILLPIPSFAATVAGGALLNPFISGVVSAAGSTVGELTAYFAGRGGEEFVKSNKTIQKLEHWMEKYGLWIIFILAAIPNPLFDTAGIIAGASGIPLKKYFVIVFAGKLLKFLVIAYLGYFLAGIYRAAF